MRVPGSCGELAQGVHKGKPYLVTCPIDAYTTVWVSDSWQGQAGLGEKSCLALKLTLDFLGKTSFPYGIRLESELPHGKGMASSSADIAAVSAAAAAALGKRLSPEEIFRIATAIEPTDPVFFPGHVCANQQDGSIYAEYADWPQLKIAIFDTGGTVDTLVNLAWWGQKCRHLYFCLMPCPWSSRLPKLPQEVRRPIKVNCPSLALKNCWRMLLPGARWG